MHARTDLQQLPPCEALQLEFHKVRLIGVAE